MKPECRPISRTSPTPFAVDFASTRAARIASLARLKAVWKPKLWSMQRDVVVDRLRDADDGDPQAPLGDHPDDLHRAAHRPVAADDEQHVDVEPLEAVDDLLGVLVAARGAQDGAAVDGDVAHRGSGLSSTTSWPYDGDEPLVAVLDADDPAHLVVVGQVAHEAGDHVVEARAEPAAGDDRGAGLRRVEEDLAAGPAGLQAGQVRRPRRPRPVTPPRVSSSSTRSVSST